MKHLLVFFTLLLSSICSAQVIDSISISPQQPSTEDTITILVYSTFNSGGCEGTTSHSVINNEIYSSSIHCVGMLTVICHDIDTFKIDPLPEGTYHFYHSLSSGSGPIPCSPGIIAEDHDTLNFTVESKLGMKTIKSHLLSVYPNPVNQRCFIAFDSKNNAFQNITIYDMQHRKVLSQDIGTNHQMELDLSLLTSGIYLFEFTGKEEKIPELIKIIKE